MFSVVAFLETVDSAVLQGVTPVPDAHVRVSGDNILVPRGLNRLAGCYAFGVNTTRARIVAPSLGNFSNYEITPHERSAEPTVPTPFHNLFNNPYELVETEFVSVEASEDGAGAQQMGALLWFSDGPVTPEVGEIVTIRATSATALVAAVWTNVPLTFASVLPGGRFGCVGARAEAAGLLAFRFVPIGTGGNFRPGAIGYDAANDVENPVFRKGGLGRWFEFDNDTPPTVDMLSVSADATQIVWLDLIYLGPSA